MKITIYNFLKYLLCIIIINSCKNKQKEEIFVKELNNINVNIGKKFILPTSLQMYRPFSSYISDSLEIADSKFKIYSRINSSCGTCIHQISLWDSLVPEFSKYNVPVILVLGTSNDYELIKYICESGQIRNFSYPFFLDTKQEYTKYNEFMNKSSDFETILTDKNNVIKLVGNPLTSESIKNSYLNEILKE